MPPSSPGGSQEKPQSREQAQLRARLETLVEVTQHKGDSECRAGAEDELCNYETLHFARMQEMANPFGSATLPPLIYAREALRAGLLEQQRIGINPFRFGLIGSTDTHFATPGRVDEDQFRGHAAGTVSARFGVPAFPDRPDFNPGGLAVLWAEENSRPALFSAMKRRKAYGTSGPRIVVRSFGGWHYPDELCSDPHLAAKGYEGGVPMGGELGPRGRDDSPSFVVSALRDPGDHAVPSTAPSNESRSSGAGSREIDPMSGSMKSPAIRNQTQTWISRRVALGVRVSMRFAKFGATRISTRSVPPSTTLAWWKTRVAAGTAGSAIVRVSSANPAICRSDSTHAATTRSRRQSRNGPRPHPSGTTLRVPTQNCDPIQTPNGATAAPCSECSCIADLP